MVSACMTEPSFITLISYFILSSKINGKINMIKVISSLF